MGCERAEQEAADINQELAPLLVQLENSELEANDPILESILHRIFDMSAKVAACPNHSIDYSGTVRQFRRIVKRHSRSWDLSDKRQRHALYRLLYGTRAAREEVVLQARLHDPTISPPIDVEPSSPTPATTPSTMIEGVRIHSGDILLSRGAMPTSAMTARGNDQPGNFSHVAVVHVDEQGKASIVEAHTACGVGISTPEQYLADTKLRILVLRLNPNVAQLQSDPMLPHKAAQFALRETTQRHIPYDFALNHTDSTRQFCSEVAYQAYKQYGVVLWSNLSTMSSRGLVRWLHRFGVRHFETQEPADLEYDPHLDLVAEFYDPQALYKEHIDNAVVDALLEGAEEGARVGLKPVMLPLVRTFKGWSMLLNMFGREGPIPEGMSSTLVLRVKWLEQRHNEVLLQVKSEAAVFENTYGYRPPYWKLVEFARGAEVETRI